MLNPPESFPNPPRKQMHPAAQFFTLFGLLIGFLFAGTLIAIAIITASFGTETLNQIMTMNISSQRTENALWILQLLGTTLPILIAPVIFSYAIMREPEKYLKTSFHFPWTLVAIVFLCMLASFPVIELLGNFNEKMVLPKFLDGVQKWMRDSEDEAQKVSDAMMQMKTLKSMIFDLLVIGLLTGIVEEFMFRGCLQTILMRWSKNQHAAVWITAILFSAFHMEFFGFLPRLVLGVLFGYFTVWSGSVWPAVWAHFVNNGTDVVLTYLAQHKMINLDPNDQHTFNTAGYIIGIIFTILFLLIYRYLSAKWQTEHLHGEELDQDLFVN
jgi:membrane protease YdiL (CAAX protease family)